MEGKSLANVMQSSTSSIVFEKEASNISHQVAKKENYIFYSLYKDKQGQFFLELFTLCQHKERDSFRCLHKAELNKKDIAISGWSFIYRIIALWIMDSHFVELYDLDPGNFNTKEDKGGWDYQHKDNSEDAIDEDSQG